MMRLRHSAIVVENFDRMLSFYQSIDLELDSRQVEQGDFIDSLVGIFNAKIETAKLNFPGGGKLEILHYHSHKVEKSSKHLSVNKIGHSHIAITVDDISHVVDRIIQLGGSLINLPAISPDGLVSECYCRDPEGNILEIVEVQS